MVPSYGPLETIQNMAESFFSKIKNERYLGWTLKMGHPVYIYNFYYIIYYIMFNDFFY